MGAAHPPAGWYDDPATPGGSRWWDGTWWTDHTQPPPPPPPPTAANSSLPAPPRAFRQPPGPEPTGFPAIADPRYAGNVRVIGRRPWWQRKRVLIPIGVMILAVVATAVTYDADPSDTAAERINAADGDFDDAVNRFVGGLEDEEPAISSPSSSTTTEPPAEVASTSSTTASSSSSTITGAPTSAPTTARPSTSPPTTVAPTTTTAPTTVSPTTAECHPAYSPCLPYYPGDALNCGDLSSSQKPVAVRDVNVDPYGLDGDNDGVGCESG